MAPSERVPPVADLTRSVARAVNFIGWLDQPGADGLEIGALHRPTVSSSKGTMRFADFTTTEELRKRYAGMPGYETIVEVDYLVEGTRYAEAVGSQRFDYVLASHVGEHNPNFIGWLLGISEILKPNGILSLILPDKRFTFDVLQKPTSATEMLWHYVRRSRRPTFLQILRLMLLHQDLTEYLSPDVARALNPRYSVAEALARASIETIRLRYFDVHCSFFTPTSFLDSMETITKLRLMPFKILEFHDTFPGDIDFMLRLQLHSRQDVSGILATIRDARQQVRLHVSNESVRRTGRSAIVRPRLKAAS